MSAIPTPQEIKKSAVLRTLIDDLLAEQKTLQTPVARFAEIHDREPDLAAHYRNLIPLTAPEPGEQYAFEVSLDRCTSCKSCVAACHSLNGLDDDEAWRDIGTLVGGRQEPAWQQTVTTACHHCADPGCMTGCPVGAYEKDKENGIVRHLDDQCIGCSYCLLKCPYDVPKYSKKRGIVRKCDMCHGRLAAGEAPACVQACPTGAIRIVKRKVSEIVDEGIAGKGFLAGAPTPKVTKPSTRYVGRPVPTTAKPADQETLTLQHAHLPLVLMLTLTQAGLGLLIAAAFLHHTAVAITGAGVFFTGMAASILHLGRPLGAWRFFLGLRTSWLSREILAFSMVAPLAMLIPALPWLSPYIPEKFAGLAQQFIGTLAPTLAILSVISVFTSVMIYVDTHRPTWRISITGTRFFGTLAVFSALGLAASSPSFLTLAVAGLAIIAKLVPESRFLRDNADPDDPWTPDAHVARLMRLRVMAPLLNGRFTGALAALFMLMISPWISIALMLVAELLERAMFFSTVYSPKMPGNISKSTRH
ncbi:dimethyl sulfoxide reductase anchor subunit [Luteolibacter ambystomatis]|uniref:Dimethyl sulfoxide reductase anchor subunit n=1 Tax=Luteolibacter ambystomatis TaxID=2824561 RepID=A0A975PFH1_9BACT|nr:DmsC/YnfH family molybdoenzyme membrane anchor subunit [Luteolibacter ambystomatis]QUE51597.1 dimethyl sulfoxide reductase anchor subunit [Luteolibacter ambystomatis]